MGASCAAVCQGRGLLDMRLILHSLLVSVYLCLFRDSSSDIGCCVRPQVPDAAAYGAAQMQHAAPLSTAMGAPVSAPQGTAEPDAAALTALLVDPSLSEPLQVLFLRLPGPLPETVLCASCLPIILPFTVLMPGKLLFPSMARVPLMAMS